MNEVANILLVIVFSSCFFHVSIAQQSYPDTIKARFINEKISLDGKLNEPSWQLANKITNFTQRELSFGKPATEKTEVAIVYDKLAMYIGVSCYQLHPEKITTKFMQRDFNYATDDNFQVLISPFNDKRNGYLFIINPNGARADLQVRGDDDNIDWNGVWDAMTTRNKDGWFAEIQIPFNTLQFKKDSLKLWAINFMREIKFKNEKDLWQGWSRDYSFENFSHAGTLTGISNIGYAKHFELKPYGLGGFEKNNNIKAIYTSKIGGDLNVNITTTLKLNVTTNTDFAQVEADQVLVNLTRFNLYYPEKREFFLESAANFQFYLGNNNFVFYSRQIGIQNFQTVSVIGGARLFGKIGKSNIGVLSLQTGEKDSLPATNNTVFRYKYDIGKQSYIGCILTSKISHNSTNQIAGIDAGFITSSFLKNKNLDITGEIAQSIDGYKIKDNSVAYRVYCDYPNDLIDHFISISSIQQNFNPELGFLNRENYNAFNWHLNPMPRWFTKFGIQQMDFQLWALSYFVTQNTKQLESWNNETRPFGFILKSGDNFQFNLQQSYDRLDNEFVLTDSARISKGKYHMHNTEFQIGTYKGRRLWAQLVYNWGTFYTGTIKTLGTEIGINISKHFNLNTSYSYNYINLPNTNVPSNELAQHINYAFTTKLDLAFFAQWNSLDDLLFGNLRLHWIPKIGTDLYIVYNRGYEQLKKLDFLKPQTSIGVGKLVWRFSF